MWALFLLIQSQSHAPQHTHTHTHHCKRTEANTHTHTQWNRSSCSLIFLQVASADVLFIFTLTILSSFTLKSSFTPNATSQVQKKNLHKNNIIYLDAKFSPDFAVFFFIFFFFGCTQKIRNAHTRISDRARGKEMVAVERGRGMVNIFNANIYAFFVRPFLLTIYGRFLFFLFAQRPS